MKAKKVLNLLQIYRKSLHVYARNGTIRYSKQKDELQNRIQPLKQWCFINGSTISAIYSDISSGISFEKRKGFFEMPGEIMDTGVRNIEYRAGENGINALIYKESYTCKYSFPDNGSIKHHEKYAVRKISRGVFRSANGMLIHAGVHASHNIIKKAIPEAFANGIDGIGLYPGSLSIKEMITSGGGC